MLVGEDFGNGVRCALLNERQLPLVIRPREGRMGSASRMLAWLAEHRGALGLALQRHGALLLRGFPVATAADFEAVSEAFGGVALDYIGGAVPRTRVTAKVFTSTEVTRLRRIRLHNELAYQRDYPDFVLFFCEQPSRSGGQTPLADCRAVYRELDAGIRTKFVDLGIRYVRTFQDRRRLRELAKKSLVIYRHLTWQDAFRTCERSVAEQKCRERGMAHAWLSGGDLSVSNVLPAVIEHPETAEQCWFNQVVVQHFNRWSWGWPEYLFRRLIYADPARLPNQAYFGDGSAIGDAEIRHVVDVTYSNAVEFDWHGGDVLLVDNRLVAHGRNPYSGPRRVYVSMRRACASIEVAAQAA